VITEYYIILLRYTLNKFLIGSDKPYQNDITVCCHFPIKTIGHRCS